MNEVNLSVFVFSVVEETLVNCSLFGLTTKDYTVQSYPMYYNVLFVDVVLFSYETRQIFSKNY